MLHLTNLDMPWYRPPTFRLAAHVIDPDYRKTLSLVQLIPPHHIGPDYTELGPGETMTGHVKFSTWFDELREPILHGQHVSGCEQ